MLCEQCKATAAFLLRDSADQDSLCSQLSCSPSHLLQPATAAAAHHHNPSTASAVELSSVESICSFLVKDESDREETVLQIKSARIRGQHQWVASSSTASPVPKPRIGVYGLESNNVFNQLVMLETPAFCTSRSMAKL